MKRRNAQPLYLMVGRDRSVLAALVKLRGSQEEWCRADDLKNLRGTTACVDVERPVCGLPTKQDFAAAVMMLEDEAPGAGPVLARAARNLVRPDAPVVIVVRSPLPSSVRFTLMTEGTDLCDYRTVATYPGQLQALIDGSWPGVRNLVAFCRNQALSPMETRAFLAACAGLSKVEAHEVLGCAIRTLEVHWSHIFGKVGIRSTEGVISAALRFVISFGPAAVKRTETPAPEPFWATPGNREASLAPSSVSGGRARS